MNYKGYIGSVSYDDENNILHGEVINTRDVITFQGKSVEELKKAFIDSIEDYLEYCKELDESPEKPFSGNLPLRITEELHREIYLKSKLEGLSINAWITQKLQKELT
jgi:predicted HicB family RNase H-like nuclease